VEIIVANLAGQSRHVTQNGREYIVAPLILIVPGVLSGSNGPLLYPPEEVAADPLAWNNMPLVAYHPTKNGVPVSARDPEILESRGIGYVFRTHVSNGRLKAEGWFDVELTRKVDTYLPDNAKILPRLEAGLPIELSTGLFTYNEPAPEGATWNGIAYSATARNYRPDHVAVLPDQVGACSLRDGCGVMVNTWTSHTILEESMALIVNCQDIPTVDFSTNAMSYGEIEDAVRQEFRKAHPVSYNEHGSMDGDYAYCVAVFDDSFIYEDGTGYHRQSYSIDANGIVTLGNDSKQVNKVVEYVEATTNLGGDPMKLSPQDRQTVINGLVANCDCWKGEGDAALLATMSDDKLLQLKAAAEKERQAMILANAAVKGVTDGQGNLFRIDPDATLNGQTRWVGQKAAAPAPTTGVNNQTTAGQNNQQGRQPGNDNHQNASVTAVVNDSPTDNGQRTTPRPPRNMEELIRSLPASERDRAESTWKTAQQIEQREKDRIISEILINVAEPDRPHRREWLQQQSTENLQQMLLVIPKAPPSPDAGSSRQQQNRGNGQRRPVLKPEEEDLLGLPQINWGDDAGNARQAKETARANADAAAQAQNLQGDGEYWGNQSEDEIIASLPPHLRSRVVSADQIVNREKEKVIEELTANIVDEQQEQQLSAVLRSKSLEELKTLLALKPTREPARPTWYGTQPSTPSGQTANSQVVDDRNEDVLPLPSIDWSQRAAN
jgi:hypothetical protein